jgi:hypothetical protein
MNLEQRLTNAGSKFNSLLDKTGDFVSRFYPELVIPGYVALTSWFTYNNDILRNPSEASPWGSIVWGIESGIVLYLGLATNRSKTKPTTSSHISIEQHVNSKKLTINSLLAGVGVWSSLFLPRIFDKLRLLKTPTNDAWQKYMVGYAESITTFSELGMKSDYLPKELLSELLVRQTFAASSMLPAYLSATYLFINFTNVFLDKQRTTQCRDNLNIIANILLKRYEHAFDALDKCEQQFVYDVTTNLYRTEIYYKQGQHNSAVLELKKARDKLEFQKTGNANNQHVLVEQHDLNNQMGTWFNQIIRRFSLKRKLNKLRKDHKSNFSFTEEEIAARYCSLAYICLLRNMPGYAFNILEEAYELFPLNLDIKALYAQELDKKKEGSSRKKALGIHQSIYLSLKENPYYFTNSCGESSKDVVVISDSSSPFLSTAYVYKKDNPRESIDASMNLKQILETRTQTLEDIAFELETSMSNNDKKEVTRLIRIKKVLFNLDFTHEIGVVNEENKSVTIMARAVGSTLRGQLTSSTSVAITDIYNILTVMAFIHAKMPEISNGERKIRHKHDFFLSRTEQLANVLSLPSDLYDQLINGYVVDHCLNFDYVFNKDSHPENWIFDTGIVPELRDKKIVAIDWDEKGLIHQTSELVNLLDTFTCFSYIFKKMFVSHYLSDYHYFNNQSQSSLTKLDNSRFMVAYLDSNYSRAIELFYSWSDMARPSMYGCRGLLLENAISSTEKIKFADPVFYNKHYLRYSSRLLALNQLISYCK